MTERVLGEVLNGAHQPDGGGLGTRGDIPLPKRNAPRGLLPTSWLGRSVRVGYVDAFGAGAESSATLIDWCGVGAVMNLQGERTVLSWDTLRSVALIED